MNSTPVRPHQIHPLVFINGRSSLLSRACSSENSTRVIQERLRHAHHIEGHHLEFPRTFAWQWARRRFRQDRASDLLRQVKEYAGCMQVDVLAHSMGCDMVHEMARMSYRQTFRRIIMLSPAAERGIEWERIPFEKMLVLYNPWDIAVMAGTVIPFGHPYGSAGFRSFKTDDPRITQVRFTGDIRTSITGHGHYSKEPYLTQVAGLVEEFLCA